MEVFDSGPHAATLLGTVVPGGLAVSGARGSVCRVVVGAAVVAKLFAANGVTLLLAEAVTVPLLATVAAC